jgi:phosphoenolpyruvate-protein kinase (PTS system EI component)
MSQRKININQNNASIGVGYGESIKAEQIGGTIHNYPQQQNLAQAAADIQQLLKQLEETNPNATETDKTMIAVKAADVINNDPTLKARVMGAIKSGGKEAFKEAVDNPIVNVLVAIVDGWQEAS